MRLYGLWFCFVAACASVPVPPPKIATPPSLDLSQRLGELVRRHEAEGASVGAMVVDAATGRTLFSHRENIRQVPASTLKLATTYAALATLGGDFRFRTPVSWRGRLVEGRFQGVLEVESSGDPSLGSWRFAATRATAVCDRVAAALRERGVTAFAGRISLTRDEDGRAPLGRGWAWDDAGSPFSAPPTRFVFHENVVEVQAVRDGAAGCDAPAQLRLEPAAAGLAARLVPLLSGGDRPLRCHRERGASELACGERPSTDCARKASDRVSVDEPLPLFTACVDAALARAGIARLPPEEPSPPPVPMGAVEGAAQSGPPGSVDGLRFESPQALLVFESPSLVELVRETNKQSINIYAERLALELSRRLTGGEDASGVGAALRKAVPRLPPRALVAVDGSGLSRMDQASPAGLMAVLQAGQGLPAFVESLPVAGVDGTLARRAGVVSGRVRAKTGTLTGQRVWAGLADRPDDSQHPRVLFVFMLNQLEQPSLAPRDTFDALAEWLATAPISMDAGEGSRTAIRGR